MHKLLLLAVVLVLPASSYADSHKDKQKHPEGFIETIERLEEKYLNQVKDAYLEYFEMGYWKKEDCKTVSDASWDAHEIAGGLLEKSGKSRDKGEGKIADELFKGAYALAEVSANFAKTFEAFCKK